VRLLLDTHALVWALVDKARLAPGARDAIEDARNDVAVSAASAWEIETKRLRTGWDVPDDLAGALDDSEFQPLAITIEHAIAAVRLPRHHDDPFDRLLVAQAQIEGLTIVTRDSKIAQYQVAVLPA
jgi:PIN domain nuclease of toxin-antitoxin system